MRRFLYRGNKLESNTDIKLETAPSTPKEYAEYVRCFKTFMDDDLCRFCSHHFSSHLGTVKQPHFFKHVEEYDDRKFLYKRKEDGLYLTKMVVNFNEELKTLFCEKCAKDLGTEQVLCYRNNTYGVGEIVGEEKCLLI